MSGFFYFVAAEEEQFPTAVEGPIDPEQLQAFGLGHLHDCEQWGRDLIASRVRGHGPNEGGGVCLYARPFASDGNEPITGYTRDRHVWQRSIDHPQVWVGMLTADPPGPADCRRRDLVTGLAVRDRVDRQWVVPVARMPDKPFGYLPTAYSFDDAGQAVPRIRVDCERLWNIGGRFFELWTDGDIQAIEDREAIDLVVEILSANYRLSKSELRLLAEGPGSVLDSDFIFTASRVICGLFGENADKKKEELTETTP